MQRLGSCKFQTFPFFFLTLHYILHIYFLVYKIINPYIKMYQMSGKWWWEFQNEFAFSSSSSSSVTTILKMTVHFFFIVVVECWIIVCLGTLGVSIETDWNNCVFKWIQCKLIWQIDSSLKGIIKAFSGVWTLTFIWFHHWVLLLRVNSIRQPHTYDEIISSCS